MNTIHIDEEQTRIDVLAKLDAALQDVFRHIQYLECYNTFPTDEYCKRLQQRDILCARIVELKKKVPKPKKVKAEKATVDCPYCDHGMRWDGYSRSTCPDCRGTGKKQP